MKSILQDEQSCFLCHRSDYTEEHHVFHGTANRKISEKYGLKVRLCPFCHRDNKNGVHGNNSVDLQLKQTAQSMAMEHYGWTVEQFIQVVGKNYLEVGNE